MKIFQIGFNKCGTTSLYYFFLLNGIDSVHWKTRIGKNRENICITAVKNLCSQKKIFEDLDYVFYSDMEYVSSKQIIYLYEYFNIIHDHYPNSKFILNTRNIDEWINSRLNHNGPLESSYLK